MTMLNRGQHCTQGGLCTGELIFKRWYDREPRPGGYRWIRVYGWVNEMDCIWNEWDPNGDGQIDRDDFLDRSITSYGKIKPGSSSYKKYEDRLNQRRCPKTSEVSSLDDDEYHCERRYQEVEFGT